MGVMLDHQFKFFRMLSFLFARAVQLQLPLKVGCAKCNEPGHHSKNSLHHDSLAIDLPMVWPDGKYGTWEDYRPLGEYWESIGGAWGGRFGAGVDGKGNDANHFSLQFGNRK